MTIGVCRLPLLAASILTACLLAAAPAGAQVPLTLTGESLKDPPGEGGTLATVSCNPVPGGLATASFESSGLAVGPYPGTYTESGTFTVATATRTEFPPAAGFQSNFRIVSGANVITGTKTMQSGFGRCEDDFGGGRDGPEVFAIARYEARIETPNGVFTDSGTSEVVVQDRQIAPIVRSACRSTSRPSSRPCRRRFPFPTRHRRPRSAMTTATTASPTTIARTTTGVVTARARRRHRVARRRSRGYPH
jgi:hypothetical protein